MVLLSSRWEDEGRNYEKRGSEVKRKLVATPFIYSNALITGAIQGMSGRECKVPATFPAFNIA